MPKITAVAVLASLLLAAPASAQTRSVSIATARHVIEARTAAIEVKITGCHRDKRWTVCEVTDEVVEEETRERTIEEGEVTRIDKAPAVRTRTSRDSWTARVYVRGRRLIDAEG